jgi:hypothetical protein
MVRRRPRQTFNQELRIAHVAGSLILVSYRHINQPAAEQPKLSLSSYDALDCLRRWTPVASKSSRRSDAVTPKSPQFLSVIPATFC